MGRGTEPYEDLANAVVLQAVKDWRISVCRIRREKKDTEAEYTRAECERFFRSEWFRIITDADGMMILKRLKEEKCI